MLLTPSLIEVVTVSFKNYDTVSSRLRLNSLKSLVLVSRAKVIENQVMAISVISVSSDSSEESVGTPAGRVILFGTIPTTILDTTPTVTPPATHIDTTLIPAEIPTVSPIIPSSPDYTPASPNHSPASDTEFDPSEDPSSDHVPPLPATSPFLLATSYTTITHP
ncbi:hypothetical protein Tco_1155892 [Tanacetum coccineum]